MALVGFKERFAPMILRGAKRHTIRAHRFKVGETLHLYANPRTKRMKLLMRVECVRVEPIRIYANRTVKISGIVLDANERELLAQADGFANFSDMLEFWKGRLPFRGFVNHWRFDG